MFPAHVIFLDDAQVEALVYDAPGVSVLAQ
jgi:hypothetical protein